MPCWLRQSRRNDEHAPLASKMCGWLAERLGGVRTRPTNPADITRITELSREAEQKINGLRHIAANLAWHADADLDLAWEDIQEYDKKWGYE